MSMKVKTDALQSIDGQNGVPKDPAKSLRRYPRMGIEETQYRRLINAYIGNQPTVLVTVLSIQRQPPRPHSQGLTTMVKR